MKKVMNLFLFSLTGFALIVCILFGYRDQFVDDLKAKYAQAPSAFIQVDGMNVHYRDEGNSLDSLPVVLIHGTGSSLHTFDDWTATLKKDKRVVRMDLPAYGLTGPFPDRNYSIDHYISFLEEFLATQGINRCILGGNSLGGLIAWRFTLKRPEMVDKLILIDAAGYPKESTSEPIAFKLARIPVLNKILTFITPRFVVKSSVQNVYADKSKISEALVDRYFDLTLRSGNRQAFVDRMKVVYDSSYLKQINRIQQPTLVLWGEKDSLITIASAYRFHHDLPNDTLVILKNSGHVPMEESSKESLTAVLSFIQK
ncbi:MAG: pimeloyl-ACP methyl ester carboxylesterase [Saprospiraceae bacterium]|jgi:pimeloyl-ACP methyl ester carboxylesterase